MRLRPCRPRVARRDRSIRLGAWLVALSLAPLSAAQAGSEAFFSPNGGGADAVARQIRAAEDSIDIAMYSITADRSNVIYKALEEAAARGVRVRMILNAANSSGMKQKSTRLEEIGVDVRYVKSTLHEKFAIFDGKALSNGSANWSKGADTTYSENTAIYQDRPRLIGTFAGEFNRLLAASKDFPGPASKGDVSPAQVKVSGRESAKVYFSGDNATDSGTGVVATQIIDAMGSAKRSIDIAVAHFNSQRIADALVALHKARNLNADPKDDIEIRVLVDLGEFADGNSRVKELEAAGIPVRYKFYSMTFVHARSQLQHHKMMIVDGKRLLSGSYNWSDTAEFSNFENVIDHRGKADRALIGQFVGQFDGLWDQGRKDLYPRFRDAILAEAGSPGYRRIIPNHFDTDYFRGSMSLSREEIKPIRGKGFAAGAFVFPGASYLDREAREGVQTAPRAPFLPTPGPGIIGRLADTEG